MRKNILIGLLLSILLFLGVTGVYSANRKKNCDDLYRQVELFSDTMAIIHNEYVDDTKPKDLIYGALKGMLTSLDPYSQFMDPESYNDLKVDTEGKFGGLGLEITIKDGLLTVITPIEDTPAWRAGVKSNDHIVKINDVMTRDMALTDAVKKMRGKPGEAVNLTVLRDSENKILNFKITRDIIKIKDIKQARILEDGIGYIRVTEFRENTLIELNNALSNLSKQNMSALIIDLRNNPGGLLDVAVKVAGRFIPADKMIAYTKGRKQDQNLEFFSDSKNAILDLPLVILINEGSASGSEIVAGVLQDYKRAILIGNTSFGKGSVQTVIPLGDGSALRLTTSHYFTPSGKIIHGKGVTPDILVKVKDDSNSKDEASKEIGAENKQNTPLKDTFEYKNDPQIMRAIETLRAIELYKQAKK